MPTYEYRCANGHEFEVFQNIKEDPLKECPECHSEVHRLISPGAGLLFKGSGFYITDYKKNGNGSNGKKEKQSETKNEKIVKQET